MPATASHRGQGYLLAADRATHEHDERRLGRPRLTAPLLPRTAYVRAGMRRRARDVRAISSLPVGRGASSPARMIFRRQEGLVPRGGCYAGGRAVGQGRRTTCTASMTECLVPQNPKKCYSTCHIKYLRLMHEALNVDEKKLIAQFGGILRDERFEPN